MDIGEILLSPKGRVGRAPFLAVVATGWAIAFDFVPFNPLLALRCRRHQRRARRH